MPAMNAETMTVQQRMRPLNGNLAMRNLFTARFSATTAELQSGSIFAEIFQHSNRVVEQFMFSGMWLLIACVSSFDTYLTIRFQEHLFYEEMNPIARFLLQIDGWEPSLLIGAKFLGSILVLGFIAALYSQNRRIGLIVTSGLASFQLALLVYLTLV
jgi:hypothetical protein